MMIRTTILALIMSLSTVNPVNAAKTTSFQSFVKSMQKDALALGVSKKTFKLATKGLKPDKRINKLTRRQPELVKPIGRYIEARIKGSLISTGRGKVKNLKQTMRRLEKIYGVDPYVVVGIWGMETGYGRGIGNSNPFRSLATLAWKRYRKDFFRNEFLQALVIMQKERRSPKQMVSSWAGAMGQTQFIPSSFRKYAVDFNKDGKRDLWGTKADALASTANYLKQKGWVRGQPWGFAVRLPNKLPKSAITQSWKDWSKAGVKTMSGKRFPKSGDATLFFPAGEEGPVFLITPNYETIRDYNSSDSYSLSVGLIANRLKGDRLLKARWPSIKTLNKAQRMRVQSLLVKKGYKVPNRTGRIIKGVRTAIRDFQMKIGVTADGYPDLKLLKQLGG